MHVRFDHKVSWVPKDWCFWTVVLEKTLESPLNCKEIQPVNLKGNKFWLFIGRTDAEAEPTILWPPDVKNWLFGRSPWFWERLKARGEGDDRRWDGWMASPTWWTWVWVSSGSWWWALACYSPQGCTELDTTEWLNWLTVRVSVTQANTKEFQE